MTARRPISRCPDGPVASSTAVGIPRTMHPAPITMVPSFVMTVRPLTRTPRRFPSTPRRTNLARRSPVTYSRARRRFPRVDCPLASSIHFCLAVFIKELRGVVERPGVEEFVLFMVSANSLLRVAFRFFRDESHRTSRSETTQCLWKQAKMRVLNERPGLNAFQSDGIVVNNLYRNGDVPRRRGSDASTQNRGL